MGSKFVEKHKRKSLLALLLVIIRGRAKYVTIVLLVVAASLPFVISGETLARFLEAPPVAAALRAVGLSGFIATINPKYSREFVKDAIDRAALDSARTSYWNRFMSAMGSVLPGQGRVTPSSLAMITGGADLEKFGRYKGGGKRPGPGEVVGVVNAEEQARGENGDAVDLAGMANSPGSSLYGDTMGSNLADRYSGEGDPYASRTMISRPGGAESRGAGMYSNALKQSGARVPIPGKPQKVSAKKMGKVSGFSWKNVGYKTKSNTVDKGIGKKSSLYRLGETYATTGSAYDSENSAYEYQAAYTGSTYDGNDVNLDIIQTDSDAPILPAGGFTDSLNDVAGLGEQAKECADAQSTNGTKMSEDAAQIEDLTQANTPPPCYDDLTAYNNSVADRGRLCEDFNREQTALANACQTSNTPMDCSPYYTTMSEGGTGLIEPACQRPSGSGSLLEMLTFLFLLAMGIAFAVFGIAGLIIAAIVGFVVIDYIRGVIAGMIADAIARAEAMYKEFKKAISDDTPGFRPPPPPPPPPPSPPPPPPPPPPAP